MTPRGLSREDAAAYLGLTVDGLDDWRRRSLIPGPIRGTRRWDRKALDVALDKLSGLTSEDEPTDALDAWRRKRAAKV